MDDPFDVIGDVDGLGGRRLYNETITRRTPVKRKYTNLEYGLIITSIILALVLVGAVIAYGILWYRQKKQQQRLDAEKEDADKQVAASMAQNDAAAKEMAAFSPADKSDIFHGLGAVGAATVAQPMWRLRRQLAEQMLHPDDNGNLLALPEYRDANTSVVIMAYTNTCPHCRNAAPIFIASARDVLFDTHKRAKERKISSTTPKLLFMFINAEDVPPTFQAVVNNSYPTFIAYNARTHTVSSFGFGKNLKGDLQSFYQKTCLDEESGSNTNMPPADREIMPGLTQPLLLTEKSSDQEMSEALKRFAESLKQ